MDLFSLDIQLTLPKKDIDGSRAILEKLIGGGNLEEIKSGYAIIQQLEKKEIDWAEYLDYTRSFEPAEINNIPQELFKKGFEKNKI